MPPYGVLSYGSKSLFQIRQDIVDMLGAHGKRTVFGLMPQASSSSSPIWEWVVDADGLPVTSHPPRWPEGRKSFRRFGEASGRFAAALDLKA